MRNGTHRFGPGSLEQIELIAAPASHQRFTAGPTAPGHTQVRVQGAYTVYCGMGNEHTEWIRTPAFCLGCGEVNAATLDDLDWDPGLEDIAAELVEWALEDWADPCDNGLEP
jgi:hypothetical protein